LVLCDPYDPAAYVDVLARQNRPFDVIVIDAEAREECLRRAVHHLTPRGVILLDDSLRPAYATAIADVLRRGFRKLHFEGLKPGGIRAYRTTLFYRPENVFEL